MTRATPELASTPPAFRTKPAGGHVATTYDLACSMSHTRRVSNGTGFRGYNPPAPSQDLTTRPPRPLISCQKDAVVFIILRGT
ncbi:hypothetical protein AVEN_261987-1, partial [Araneus ventricosus]